MFIDELTYFAYCLKYDGIIQGMEEKLLKAIEKNPGVDYSDAKEKVVIMGDLKMLFHKMYNNQQAIEGMNFRVTKKAHDLIEENKLLRAEIEKLKSMKEF